MTKLICSEWIIWEQSRGINNVCCCCSNSEVNLKIELLWVCENVSSVDPWFGGDKCYSRLIGVSTIFILVFHWKKNRNSEVLGQNNRAHQICVAEITRAVHGLLSLSPTQCVLFFFVPLLWFPLFTQLSHCSLTPQFIHHNSWIVLVFVLFSSKHRAFLILCIQHDRIFRNFKWLHCRLALDSLRPDISGTHTKLL